MNKKIWTPLLLLSSLLAFTACDDDDDDGLSGEAPNADDLGGARISFNPEIKILDDAQNADISDLDEQLQLIDGVEDETEDIPDTINASVEVTNELDREIEVTFGGLPPLAALDNEEPDLRVVLRNFEPSQEDDGEREFTLDWFIELNGDKLAERRGISATFIPGVVADDQDGEQQDTVTSPGADTLVGILTDGASFDPGTDVIEIVDGFEQTALGRPAANVNLTQAGTELLVDPDATEPATAPGVVTYEKTGDSTGLLTVTVDAIGVEVTANLLFQDGTSGIWNGSLTQDAENTVGDNEGEKLIVPIESGEPFEVK